MMSNFSIVLIALALVLYFGHGLAIAGSKMEKSFSAISKALFLYIIIQWILLMLGINVGNRLSGTNEVFNIITFLVIMIIFGLKMFISSINTSKGLPKYDFSKTKSTALLAAFDGITTFVIAIAVGVLIFDIRKTAIIIGSVLAVGIILFFLIGNRIPEIAPKLRFGPIAGLILIILAIVQTVIFFL
jgi:hypothetical protein